MADDTLLAIRTSGPVTEDGRLSLAKLAQTSVTSTGASDLNRASTDLGRVRGCGVRRVTPRDPGSGYAVRASGVTPISGVSRDSCAGSHLARISRPM